MRYVIAIALACIAMATPAAAQRCPAGQDQFHNCLSMNPQMRAKQEAWANQPAARQLPGAQPHGTAPAPARTSSDCRYQGVPCTVNTPSGPVALFHHRDGKSTSYTTTDGRSGTLVSIKCGKDYCIYNNGRLWRRVARQ
jgi:hypothetical protein